MIKLEEIEFLKTHVDEKDIRNYKSEDDFMSLGVGLFKEVGVITTVVASSYRLGVDNKPRKWTRDEAVLGGLLVRLSKLQMGLLDQICQKRVELSMIFVRCIGENLINLNYLLSDSSEDDVFNKFIEYSLREEKRLLNRINSNIKKRGSELPIEKRMKKSIMQSFNISNFKIQDVDEKNFKSWEKTIRQRAKTVGRLDIYTVLVSLPSHNVHGNWQDLIANHLEYEDGEFSPKTEWTMPKPQILFGIAGFSIETARCFVDSIFPDCPDKDKILSLCEDVSQRIILSDKLHEEFLQNK